MLDANIKKQLKSYLEKVVNPIVIEASVDDSDKSREMLALLHDIAALHDQITVNENRDDAHRKPSFALNRPDQELGIRFAGIPMGHEFSSLVLALLQAGGHPPKVDPEIAEQVRDLEGEFVFETYVSLSCQNCPEVVQALNTMAILNPNISHVMIDGAVFQEEVDEKQIMAVPTVHLNGKPFGQGRMTLEDILRKVDTGAAERDAARLDAKETYDMLIVGGGPAGAAAAIYAARKGIRTGIVGERFGGQVLDTATIENFVSVSKTEGIKLAADLEAHVKQYDVDIINGQVAAGLNPGKPTEVKLASGATLRGKAVLIATGARWRELNVPGEREYTGRGVAYCPHCDGPLFKGKRVAVIGGGNSGVEAAIDLAGIVKEVTLIEFDDQLRADEVLQKKVRSLPNVEVIVSAQTTEVHGDGNKVNGLTYKDRNSEETHRIELDGVFVQIGLVPNTAWLEDTDVKLTSYGEIEVDTHGRTSVPGVFAAGDATTTPYKQIVTAMGDGAKASLSAFDYLVRSSVEEGGKVDAA